MPKPEDAADYYMFVTSSADGQILFWDTKFDNKDKKANQIGTSQPDYTIPWKGILSVQLQRPEGGQLGASNISFNVKHKVICLENSSMNLPFDLNPTLCRTSLQPLPVR